MTYGEDIEKALLAHGKWRERLQAALKTGTSEFTVAAASTDNGCEFGKWFYALPAAMRSGVTGSQVKELHAQFHKEAGRILGLALAGKRAEAQAALEITAPYATASGKLSLTLKRWKQELEAPR